MTYSLNYNLKQRVLYYSWHEHQALVNNGCMHVPGRPFLIALWQSSIKEKKDLSLSTSNTTNTTITIGKE